MAVRVLTPQRLPRPARSVARRPIARDPTSAGGADIRRDPNLPTVGIHWGIIAIALGAAVWFLVAAVVFYGSGDPLSDYLLWIVAGFAVLFFGLTLGLARWAADDPRWASRRGRVTLAESVDDNVALATGVVAGREAMVQLLTIPISLAIGATILGIVFAVIR